MIYRIYAFYLFLIFSMLLIGSGCGEKEVDEPGNGNLCDDITCPAGQTCDPAEGICVPDEENGNKDPCENVACPAGQYCDPATGTCVAEAENGNGNGNGDLCENVVCPGGQTCDPTTGNCVPDGENGNGNGIPGCEAHTCDDFGAVECGTYDDGCGGTINCGTCPETHNCVDGACIPSQVPTMAISELNIGDEVIDLSWTWEYRLGDNYTSVDGANIIDDSRVFTGPVVWIVVSKNHHDVFGGRPSITLMSRDLIARHVFHEAEWNQWRHSGFWDEMGLRPFLNSTRKDFGVSYSGHGFLSAFSEEFEDLVQFTYLPSMAYDDNGNLHYTTYDRVFAASEGELGGRTTDGTSPYSYFDESHIDGPSELDELLRRRRGFTIENDDYYPSFYWTRTPAWCRTHNVRSIARSGEFYTGSYAHLTWYGNSSYNEWVQIRAVLNIFAGAQVSTAPDEHGMYEIIHGQTEPPLPAFSCSELDHCIHTCNTDSNKCTVQKCHGNATATAVSQSNALYGCAEQNGCLDWACVEEHCAAEISSCFDDTGPELPPDNGNGNGNGNGQEGHQSCYELMICYENCDDDDLICYQNCYDEATNEARTLEEAIYDCIQQHNCVDEACAMEHCHDEIMECYGLDDSGTMNCSELNDCYFDCNDEECMMDCYMNATPEARQQSDIFWDCMDDNNCLDCPDETCLESCIIDHCLQEFINCFE